MSVAWTYPTGGAIHGCPALGPDGAVYVGSYDGNVYALNGDGSERWTFATGDQVRYGLALAADGTVYAGSMDWFLYAIGPDGSERWRYDTNGPIVTGPAIGTDGAIFIGSTGGWLIALNSDGSRRWRYRAYGSIVTRPALGADGLVYFGNESGLVFALNQDGTRHWRYVTGGEIGLGLALGNDGTLYAGSADGSLYAFGGGADGTPATINEIGPQEGQTGTEMTLGTMVEGTPPFTYSWELGGGGTPDPASGASPAVTLGEPGIYAASVTVSNDYGDPDTQEFDLYVQPAPAGDGDWIHSWGGFDEEGLTDLAVDAAGQIHAVGYTYSAGAGNLDVLLLDYAADGSLLAARTWGGPNWDEGHSIWIDGDDNVYVGGTCTPEIGDDTLLLRFDAEGELSWARSWTNTHADHAGAVAVADDGTIYLAGGTTGAHPTGEYGALLLTYSASGDLLGTLTWETEYHERFTDLAIDGDSNIIIAGELYDDDTGSGDAVLMQLDSTLTINWVRRFGSADDVRYCRLALDAEDNIYVSCGAPQLLKYDSAGNLLWARYWTEYLDMMASGLAVNGTRLVVVGGYYDLDHENFNAFMMSGGTDGSVAWARMFNTAYDDDIILGLALPAVDTAYMCGEGWTNLGTWQDVAVLSAEAPGTSEAIVGVLGAPAGTETDPGGMLQDASGIEDAPAGETNTTAYRLGLE
jgi:outer membrane protein assembly factor BamB